MWYNEAMDQRVRNKVLEISEYLPKDKSGAPIVPVDLDKILQKFGLKAYNTNFSKPEISGAFSREEKQIYLDATDPYTRKVFTLAHELGHYFLHDDKAYDILYREKRSHARPELEREADEFAAELLMPEATIRLYWPIAESIQQLAEIFSVSYSAMEYRLRNLGFI